MRKIFKGIGQVHRCKSFCCVTALRFTFNTVGATLTPFYLVLFSINLPRLYKYTFSVSAFYSGYFNPARVSY